MVEGTGAKGAGGTEGLRKNYKILWHWAENNGILFWKRTALWLHTESNCAWMLRPIIWKNILPCPIDYCSAPADCEKCNFVHSLQKAVGIGKNPSCITIIQLGREGCNTRLPYCLA